MTVAIAWIILAGFVGAGASARGRSGAGWFVLALLITPLLAGIGLLLVGSSTPVVAMRACPECAEPILAEAKRCKHCGSTSEPSPAPAEPEYYA